MGENRTTALEEPSLSVLDPPRSVFRRKRFLVPFVPSALVALVGVALLVVFGMVSLPFDRIVVIEGKLASKADFFNDGAVRRILMANGVQVHITTAGSRSIATDDLDDFDFVFPSGQPAALLIRNERERQHQYSRMHKLFFSPIVLATYRDYAKALPTQPQNGVDPLYYNLPMDRFLAVLREGRTWQDRTLPNGNRILAQTSDVCSSNSAATYLGLIAFEANHKQIPTSEEVALALADDIKPLLTGQGLPGDDMAKQYLAPEGQGLAPLVVIYEHQYLAHQVRVRQRSGSLDKDRVLLYPEAQVQTVPEFIALTPAGDRLGDLITKNEELRQRALELGFRVFEPDGTLSTGRLSQFLESRGIPVPQTGGGDTETFLPALPLLEKMIVRVGDCPEATP